MAHKEEVVAVMVSWLLLRKKECACVFVEMYLHVYTHILHAHIHLYMYTYVCLVITKFTDTKAV